MHRYIVVNNGKHVYAVYGEHKKCDKNIKHFKCLQLYFAGCHQWVSSLIRYTCQFSIIFIQKTYILYKLYYV